MARTISKVAKKLGINIETVRFYERKGLIKQPAKPAEGYRDYPSSTVARIRFIKRSQELGFSLIEIEGLLCLEDSPCEKVQELAENKLSRVQDKINDLRELEKTLKTMVKQCKNNPNSSRCPVIDDLQA